MDNAFGRGVTKGGASDPYITELQSTVEHLRTVVYAPRKTTIDNLTRKLNFVLSFLDIHDDTSSGTSDGVPCTTSAISQYSVWHRAFNRAEWAYWS